MSQLEPPKPSGRIDLPNGCSLYWEQDEHGRTYTSDEVGGGVFVWQPALVAQSTLLAAIVLEEKFRVLEAEIARRARSSNA